MAKEKIKIKEALPLPLVVLVAGCVIGIYLILPWLFDNPGIYKQSGKSVHAGAGNVLIDLSMPAFAEMDCPLDESVDPALFIHGNDRIGYSAIRQPQVMETPLNDIHANEQEFCLSSGDKPDSSGIFLWNVPKRTLADIAGSFDLRIFLEHCMQPERARVAVTYPLWLDSSSKIINGPAVDADSWENEFKSRDIQGPTVLKITAPGSDFLNAQVEIMRSCGRPGLDLHALFLLEDMLSCFPEKIADFPVSTPIRIYWREPDFEEKEL